MVTGASAGIGKAVASRLAVGGALVVMVCRDRFRGKAAATEIGARTASPRANVMVGDLSSEASVRAVAERVTAAYPRVDILIYNAGVFKKTRTLTVDGLETVFATNHLGHFLLTNLLLGSLRAAGDARILNITAPSTVRLDFENLQGERRFNALTAFGATKMANLLFTFDLAKRFEGSGVTVNAVHPGMVRSHLMREAPAPLRWITSLFSASPDRLPKLSRLWRPTQCSRDRPDAFITGGEKSARQHTRMIPMRSSGYGLSAPDSSVWMGEGLRAHPWRVMDGSLAKGTEA